MGLLVRNTFARGWLPDADAVNGPADGLLRMDNLTLDELGVLALRLGSEKVNASPLADADVHSLYTAILNGTRYRMVGAGNRVYANGTALASGLGGSGDVSFGSHLGQILFARGGSTLKFDGSTVRGWGIPMTGGAPTVAALTPDSKTYATGASGESPNFAASTGTTIAYVAGEDGTGSAALQMTPAGAAGVATVSKSFATPQDFSVYDAGETGVDSDLVEMSVYVSVPSNLLTTTIQIDCDPTVTNAFSGDYFSYTVTNATAVSTVDTPATPIASLDGQPAPDPLSTPRPGKHWNQEPPVTQISPAAPLSGGGWTHLKLPRGQFMRVGSKNGLGWNTVIGVRVITEVFASQPVVFQNIIVKGGNLRPLTGTDFQWCYVYAENTGEYVGLSAPSDVCAKTALEVNGAAVTAPADGGRPSQVNEIWFFRGGGTLDQFYYVGKVTSVSGTGSYLFDDTTSDVDTLLTGIPVVTDNGPPPANIIGLAGPFYDRMMALTSTSLYPSRRLNPDSFAAGQVIRMAGDEEVCYWVHKALGGIYVGTSKDIYRVDGTGAELPDGTIDFVKTPVNIDHPPINDGIAQDGNQLIYMADTGWRAFTGTASQSLSAHTIQLFKGQTRHGVEPVNVTGGRFRATIAKGQLACLMPEGASTTSTAALWRNVAPASQFEAYQGNDHWYRHTYPQPFRSIYREPDGTVLAGDTTGTVWKLDSGSGDDGQPIPVTLWTKYDDDAKANQRKDPWDVRVHVDTGGRDSFVQALFDSSTTLAMQYVANLPTEGYSGFTMQDLAVFRQVQLRVTGSFFTFRLFDFAVGYREHPLLSYFTEPKPQTPSAVRRRFSGIQFIVDTLGLPATVTPMLDGVAQTPLTVTTADALARSLTFPAIVGRDLWARVSSSTGFEPYELTPRIIEELPAVMQGLLPKSLAGSPGQKMCSGIQLRACTLGVERLVTPYLDGVPQDAYPITSGPIEPMDFTLALPQSVQCSEITMSSDGDLEIYAVTPLITSRRPLGVRAWDSGPLDIGGKGELVWLRRLYLKVNAGADLSIVAYMDGKIVARQTARMALNVLGAIEPVDTIVPVDIGRGCVGRQPRLAVTSTAPFFPWWVRAERRTTGGISDRPSVTIPVSLGA